MALADPEEAVCAILHAQDEDPAHGRHNTPVRQVVSFEHAAAHERRCPRRFPAIDRDGFRRRLDAALSAA